MGRQRTMQRFAKWHIWLGWLVGFPLLMWTVTGLVMAIRPIEEVRGDHLRRDVAEQPLPPDTRIDVSLPTPGTKPVRSVSTSMERGEVVTRIEYLDNTSERFRSDGSRMGPLTDIEARQIVASAIEGGDDVETATRYDADETPFDFRREEAVWQLALADGTHVYVGSESGQIAAVRTPWWRLFDFMWGLHIMDLQTREDTSHPILILFATLSVVGSIFGCILMFRRRKARVKVPV